MTSSLSAQLEDTRRTTRRSRPQRSQPDREAWPIGAIVAAYWVAHQSGPSPSGPDVLEAVALGLIDLAGEWSITERGEFALREHRWL